MLYSDLVKQNNGAGIYTELVKDFTDTDLNKITNSILTAKDLDNRFCFENNNKDCLFSDFPTAVSVLKAKYYTKWTNLINGFINNDKIKNGASSVTVATGDSKQTAQVSAYDSSDLIDDSGNTANSNTQTSVYDLNGLNFIMSVYKNNLVYDTINTDIRRTLFSNVYSLTI